MSMGYTITAYQPQKNYSIATSILLAYKLHHDPKVDGIPLPKAEVRQR